MLKKESNDIQDALEIIKNLKDESDSESLAIIE